MGGNFHFFSPSARKIWFCLQSNRKWGYAFVDTARYWENLCDNVPQYSVSGCDGWFFSSGEIQMYRFPLYVSSHAGAENHKSRVDPTPFNGVLVFEPATKRDVLSTNFVFCLPSSSFLKQILATQKLQVFEID
jgi:hypothetical protein